MTVSRLLKSWATPPASWPIAFHLLRLEQLRLERLPFADVDRDAEQASGPARLVEQQVAAAVDPVHRAVRPLGAKGNLVVAPGGDGAFEFLQHDLAVFLMNAAAAQPGSGRFHLRPDLEQGAERVGGDLRVALEIELPDAHPRRGEGEARSLLVLREHRLDPPALDAERNLSPTRLQWPRGPPCSRARAGRVRRNRPAGDPRSSDGRRTS